MRRVPRAHSLRALDVQAPQDELPEAVIKPSTPTAGRARNATISTPGLRTSSIRSPSAARTRGSPVSAATAAESMCPARGCPSCHDPPHPAYGSCVTCHTMSSWASNFAHPIALGGVHASFACSRCHVNGITSPGVGCSSCHGSNHGGLTNCAQCHTMSGWRPSTFQASGGRRAQRRVVRLHGLPSERQLPARPTAPVTVASRRAATSRRSMSPAARYLVSRPPGLRLRRDPLLPLPPIV